MSAFYFTPNPYFLIFVSLIFYCPNYHFPRTTQNQEEKPSQQKQITTQRIDSVQAAVSSDADQDPKIGSSVWGDILCALNLILADVIWGVIASVLAISFFSVRQAIPSFRFCVHLEKETLSEKKHQTSILNYIIQMIWQFSYHSIPFITFLLLTQSTRGQSLCNFFKYLIRSWWNVIKIPMIFGGITTLYTITIYFLFSFNNEYPQYPWWYLQPYGIIWIIGAIAVCIVTSKIWTTKHSTYFVLQQHFNQRIVQINSIKVNKAFRNAMLLSVVLPVIILIVMQSLLNSFHVSEEPQRFILIVVMSCLCNPLWLILDKRSKKPLPWIHPIKQHINSLDTNSHHPLSNYEQSDPICLNGFVLPGPVFTGTIIVIRILQANMSTLLSKIAMGVFASALESFLVVIKPHLYRNAKKVLDDGKIFNKSRIFTSSFDLNSIETAESHERVHRWYRAHTIVYVNRLEMFSLIFCHLLMMSSVRVKNQAMQLTGSTLSECESSSIFDFFISMIVLCLLEVFIEGCTYIYLLRVEKLQLVEVARRSRFKFCFLYFAVMTVINFAELFSSMPYTILSCGGMNESFYIYICF